MYWRGPIRMKGGGHIVKWWVCIMQSGGGVFCKVEGVHFAKWRGCILQSRGGLKVVGVYFIFYRVSVTIMIVTLTL